MFLITSVLVFFYIKTPKNKIRKGTNQCSCIKEWNYISLIIVNSLFAFSHLGFRLIFPLFCKVSADKGGLEVNSERILSLIQGCSGVMAIAIPPILIPLLKKKYGIKYSLFYLCFGNILTISLLFCAKASNDYLKIGFLTISYGLTISLSLIFFPYISIGLGNSVSSEIFGSSFGFSNFIVGNFRLLSNIIFGLVFSWSVEDGIEFPGIDSSFSILVLNLLFFITSVCVILILNSSIEKRQEDNSKSIALIDKKN